MIQETLRTIKEHTGLTLTPCDHFTGILFLNCEPYFNVLINDPAYDSEEYAALCRFADKYGLIRVEPNGWKRLAIFVIKEL